MHAIGTLEGNNAQVDAVHDHANDRHAGANRQPGHARAHAFERQQNGGDNGGHSQFNPEQIGLPTAIERQGDFIMQRQIAQAKYGIQRQNERSGARQPRH